MHVSSADCAHRRTLASVGSPVDSMLSSPMFYAANPAPNPAAVAFANIAEMLVRSAIFRNEGAAQNLPFKRDVYF